MQEIKTHLSNPKNRVYATKNGELQFIAQSIDEIAELNSIDADQLELRTMVKNKTELIKTIPKPKTMEAEIFMQPQPIQGVTPLAQYIITDLQGKVLEAKHENKELKLEVRRYKEESEKYQKRITEIEHSNELSGIEQSQKTNYLQLALENPESVATLLSGVMSFFDKSKTETKQVAGNVWQAEESLDLNSLVAPLSERDKQLIHQVVQRCVQVPGTAEAIIKAISGNNQQLRPQA
jgi:hypothetical protein